MRRCVEATYTGFGATGRAHAYYTTERGVAALAETMREPGRAGPGPDALNPAAVASTAGPEMACASRRSTAVESARHSTPQPTGTPRRTMTIRLPAILVTALVAAANRRGRARRRGHR